MDLGVRFLDVLFPFAAFLFPAWPIIFIAPLGSKRNFIPKVLVLWLIFVALRVLLIFSPLPTVAYLIPEPLSTYLFVASGLLLAAGYVVWIGRRRSLS